MSSGEGSTIVIVGRDLADRLLSPQRKTLLSRNLRRWRELHRLFIVDDLPSPTHSEAWSVSLFELMYDPSVTRHLAEYRGDIVIGVGLTNGGFYSTRVIKSLTQALRLKVGTLFFVQAVTPRRVTERSRGKADYSEENALADAEDSEEYALIDDEDDDGPIIIVRDAPP